MNTLEIDINIVHELHRLAEMTKVDGKYSQVGLAMQTAATMIESLDKRNEVLEDKLCQIEYIVAGALR